MTPTKLSIKFLAGMIAGLGIAILFNAWVEWEVTFVDAWTPVGRIRTFWWMVVCGVIPIVPGPKP